MIQTYKAFLELPSNKGQVVKHKKMWGIHMKQIRKYPREFKLKVLRECETGKDKAQLSREYSIHPSLITRWEKEYIEYPENAFSGSGNIHKENTRISELERVIGQLYAENVFFEKALSHLKVKFQEQRRKVTRR